jgi:hypothetical protein
LSLRSPLRQGLSFELFCSELCDATDFCFDCELDDGVGRDDLDLESEGRFDECDNLDSLSEGLVDVERDDLVLESAGGFDSDAERDDLILELAAVVDSDVERERRLESNGSMIFFGDCDDSVLESEARLVLESERGVDCDGFDSESDESGGEFCLGCGGAIDCDFDSESGVEAECDSFFSGRSDASDFCLGRGGATDFWFTSESDVCLETEDLFSGRRGALDFDLNSDSDSVA